MSPEIKWGYVKIVKVVNKTIRDQDWVHIFEDDLESIQSANQTVPIYITKILVETDKKGCGRILDGDLQT